MMAVLLVFMGLYLPLALILGAWLKPWSPLAPPVLAPTGVATVAIWSCYGLLRRGRFSLAAALFLAVTLSGLGWNYFHWGLGLQVGTQLITLLPALLGALLLGRWVLRSMPRHLFAEAVEVDLQLSPGPHLVFFDRAQLELVLLNLASNAAEAMPDGGTFTLAVAGDADWVELKVADTGRGMTAEELARCREPFYTTKPPGQGTGLGLAVAADLAERAGGSLRVDSAPGRGTVVRIRLPRRTRPR